MIKRWARSCVSAGCRGSALLKWGERRARGGLVVLCYHRVLPIEQKKRYALSELVVTPQSFEQHCLVLRRHYEVLPLHAAVQALRDGGSRRRPIAAITFDDGYQDNFKYAVPILEAFGIQATFFVITDLIGTARVPWYDRLARSVTELASTGGGSEITDVCRTMGTSEPTCPVAVCPKSIVHFAKLLPPVRRAELVQRISNLANSDGDPPTDDLIMDWAQLTAMTNAGHEIGSHSGTHEFLTQLDDSALEEEVAGSRRRLAEGLKESITSFCYPNGDFNERVVGVVASSGFSCAVTVESGANECGDDPFRLARRFIHEDRLVGVSGVSSPTLLRMELCGLSDLMFRRRPRRRA